MTFLKGKYKDKKIILDSKLNLKDNTEVKVSVVTENPLNKFLEYGRKK